MSLEQSLDPGAAVPGAAVPGGVETQPEPDGHAPSDSGAEDGTESSGIPGAPRKRRRGSRGGRNRAKKPAGSGTDLTDESDDVDADRGDDLENSEKAPGGEDYHDSRADRGLTTEDAFASAREEAGIAPAAPKPKIGDSRPAPKPQIGDSRPAPVAGDGPTASASAASPQSGDAPAKKRRRRGGRGRGKGGGGQGGGQGQPQGQQQQGQQGQQGQQRGQKSPQKPTYIEGGIDLDEADGAAILEQLDDATLERRRGQSRKGRPTGRYQMIVHLKGSNRIAQIAVLEGRTLVEHYISEPADDTWSIDGNIYLGKVQNVLPGMEAAFVDIGTPKNGVLYRGDVAFEEGEHDGDKPKIERMLRNGQSIIVQVTKNPIGHKGARLTQEVSLAGRFVVMVPGQPGTYGISKRMPDDERKRLRRILDKLRPKDAGLIVRTAAEGATEDELALDMKRLQSQWEQIAALAKQSKPGSTLYKEPQLVLRIIREEFTKEFRSVVIDDRELYEQVRSYLEAMAPELVDRLEYYDPAEGGLPVFEKFHVHEQLHKALDRKVWLPSGGSLVIERTEALTVIDVNTGKNVGRSNLEETVYRNNLEAADAIARELRLRDIGGIIVIDFIDMEIKKNREDVERTFREALARDKTRTQMFPISELGLLEMTRKRISEGLVESFSETCATCNGRGIVLDESMLE